MLLFYACFHASGNQRPFFLFLQLKYNINDYLAHSTSSLTNVMPLIEYLAGTCPLTDMSIRGAGGPGRASSASSSRDSKCI